MGHSGLRIACCTALVVGASFLLVGFSATPAVAQILALDTLGIAQEVLMSDFFGADARTVSMGNTGLALTRDGAALIYNPANLARVKRLELRAGFSHLRLSNDTRFVDAQDNTLTAGRDLTKTRINALSLTVPVPTYRGSLVFGFGVHRVNSFDRTFEAKYFQSESDPDQFFRAREVESGSIWKWTAAGAVDISPRVAVGAGLNLLTGGDEYRYDELDQTTDNITTFDQLIELDYVGVSVAGGLSFSVSPELTAGLTIESPTLMQVDERSYWEYEELFDTVIYYNEGFSSYSLTRPMVFGFGAAGSFDRFNLASDIRYTDWTQLEFDYDGADLDAAENATLLFIQENLTDVLSIHLGGEFLFPEQGLTLRAGYFRDPLPIDEQYVEKQRQYITAGVGFLIDRVMTLDLAYVHGGYELRNADPGTYNAEYKNRRAFVTFGYRI